MSLVPPGLRRSHNCRVVAAASQLWAAAMLSSSTSCEKCNNSQSVETPGQQAHGNTIRSYIGEHARPELEDPTKSLPRVCKRQKKNRKKCLKS